MNFVTKAVFLATKNISSLIFVTKNTFCCSDKTSVGKNSFGEKLGGGKNKNTQTEL